MAYRGLDRLLNHFLAVAEKGSITAAARSLNISQPALTRNIRLLEQSLEVRLLDRLPNGVSLTNFGDFLARRARFMQLEFDHALTEIEALKGGHRGELNIGVISAWGLIYIPEIIALFREEVRGVKINIFSDLSGNLISRLLNGELDLVCSGLSFPNHPQLVKEPLIQMERVVVANAGHPLTNRDTLTAADLLQYGWGFLRGDEIATSRLGAYFLSFGLAPPKVELECDSINELLSILRSTELLGTAPKPVAEDTAAHGLSALPIEGSLWHYESGMAYRREPNPPRALVSFLAYARSYFANKDHAAGSPASANLMAQTPNGIGRDDDFGALIG